ncbi:hypothetical protein A2Z56_02470 [Candidatus Kaiserbacteria bacterium RIFCSPHIGHO2_12_45_16]|nr:MAG: hypothetical protein A2Z56_02470 [Candidatus Kaiserbacteria bacterium RIFCSPHIGHO2_12_45_16]
MIKVQRIYHHNGKIVVQHIDGNWFELESVTSNLVDMLQEPVTSVRIENPYPNTSFYPKSVQINFQFEKERIQIAVEEALREEKLKHYTLVNYILNKNSHPEGKGINFEKAYRDFEEYEKTLE